MNLFTKQKKTHRFREQTYGWDEGEGGKGGSDRKFGMDMYTPLHLKWITNKDLLYSTWNSAQFWQSGWKGNLGGEWIHVYLWLSPFSGRLKLSKHSFDILICLAILKMKLKVFKKI